MTTTTSKRVAQRFLHGEIFKKLETPIILSDSGICTVDDLARLLALHGVYVFNVVLHRSDNMPRNVFVWNAEGSDGYPVRGQLQVHLQFNHSKIMLSAEVTLLNLEHGVKEAGTGGLGLSMKRRLQLISSISRRAIIDLRERPTEVAVVLAHLVDVAELADSMEWNLD